MKMSRAKIGSSAVALPSSTANKSSRIAPSTTLWRPMKARPPNSILRSTGSRVAATRSSAMPRMIDPADSQSSAQRAKFSVGLSTISAPPSAGPAMIAVCAAEVEAAMARGSRCAGTMLGKTDCRLGCSRARPMPTQKAMARRRCGVSCPVAVASRKDGHGKRLHQLRRPGDDAPVITICRVSGEQEQADGRDELHQPDRVPGRTGCWSARTSASRPRRLGPEVRSTPQPAHRGNGRKRDGAAATAPQMGRASFEDLPSQSAK